MKFTVLTATYNRAQPLTGYQSLVAIARELRRFK
jgi:hypothetical protein